MNDEGKSPEGFTPAPDPGAPKGRPEGEEFRIPPAPNPLLAGPSGQFACIKERIDRLFALRRRSEEAMESLKDEFNLSVGRTRLRLRPWAYRNGESPYAIYWIFVNLRRRLSETVIDHAIDRLRPRGYRRLRYKNRRELTQGIFRGGLWAVRSLVWSFDRRARSLNDAHAAAAGALYGLFRLLRGRMGGKYDPTPIPLLPRECSEDLHAWPRHRLYAVHWKFLHVLWFMRWRLQDLADRNGAGVLPGGLRLRYESGLTCPNGRLVWYTGRGRLFAEFPPGGIKALGFPPDARKQIRAVERERRELMDLLSKRGTLLWKLWRKSADGIRIAERHLAKAGFA